MSETNKKMQKILFVDDERPLLNSFERILMDYDYEIFTAESGKEALEILEEESNIDLIISDMRMPYMDGYELLSKVKQEYPHTVRVLLSGYADESIVYKALQKNIAKLYLMKPWNTSYLLQEIEHIFSTEASFDSEVLSNIVNNSITLFEVNNNYKNILELVERDMDIDILVEEISKDISISTSILRIANSAFFKAKTNSIKDAIIYIGNQSLYTFLKTASLISTVNSNSEKSKFLNKLWEVSFLTNKICITLYNKFLSKQMPSSYISTGLLCNIGLAVIIDTYPQEYKKILKAKKKSEFDLLSIEEKLISATHQQIGAYLLDGWDFPYPIVEAALYHHTPLDNRIINKELLLVVNIAQNYAYKLLDFSDFPINMQEYINEMKIDCKVFDELKVDKNEVYNFFNSSSFNL